MKEQLKKEEIYLDLSKLSEEEIKEIYKKIKNSDQNIHTQTKRDLINGIVTHCYWFLFFDGNAWNQNETSLSGRTELTYPEFIKLFEGGESDGWIKIESEKDLPKEEDEFWVFENNEVTKTKRKIGIDNNDYWWLNNITHYQPIIKPLPPKF